MTQALGESEIVRLCKARGALHQMMATLLAGTGAEIREREHDLVIRDPQRPENGRIYISYATGEVIRKWTVEDYCGSLAGYSGPASGQGSSRTIDRETIISMLGREQG